MNRTIGHGNGNGETTGVPFTSAIIEENPYLRQRRHEGPLKQARDRKDALGESVEDEEGPPVELEDERRKLHQRRRRLAMAGVASFLMVSLVGAAALYYRTATRVEYGTTTRQPAVLAPPPNVTTATGRDSRTEQAIEEAQRLTSGKPHTSGTTVDRSTEARDVPANSVLSHDSPFKTPTGFSGTFNGTADGTDKITKTESSLEIERGSSSSSSTAAAGNPGTIRSMRSSESSLYMNHAAPELRVDVNGREDAKSRTVREEKAGTVTLPAFASMLPVRTVGALFTLRTGALVRCELTRDTKGNGWFMKRGTILVGTGRGSDFDRAYVSIMGFIDPQSGKLVKLNGDVRGGDGGSGLKGKRRQLDGGWMRALGHIGTAALDVTGALLSGGGRDTVIISDGLRTRAINPVTDEISGVLGTELDRRQSRSFVEVAAGTPGYVMVTDLPGVIKGTDATPELDSETLASLTNVNSARPATGLTERELADLLATGSPEQIRAAMPRMSTEMRKIAVAVLHP